MRRSLSTRLAALLMVAVLSCLGYTAMMLSVAETGVPGYVVISPDVTIRQGNGVNYSFSERAVVSKLELKSASIEINDNFEIGAVTSAGYLSNELVAYDPSSNIRWLGTCTDAAATVTYTLSGLLGETNYEVWVDGCKVRTLSADVSGSIQYVYQGTWSTHEFIVQKSDVPSVNVQACFEYRLSGSTVYFTDKSYGNPTVWIWDFGDGFGSTSQSPTHDFKERGSYQVSLTVYDSMGRSSVAQTNIVIALDEDNPIDYNDEGWSIFVGDGLTLRVSALGLIVMGAIMFLTGMFLNLPIITNKGRKVIGALLMIAGAYYFIFVDNGWMG